MKLTYRRWGAVSVALLAAGLSATAMARPGPERQAGRQERLAAAKQNAQQMRAKFVALYGDELAELKLKGEELRAAYSDEIAHFKDLATRAQQGALTAEEQAELDQLQKKANEAKVKLKALEPGEAKAALKKAITDNQAEILALWGVWILQSSDAQSELEKNARRVAGLEQAAAVAKAQGRDDLVAHISDLSKAENARHEAAMKLLTPKGAGGKGAP